MCYNSILQAIGSTPLLEVEPGIYTKCEFKNPSGSIKSRLAHYMVEKAEQEGLIKPGDTIVEATSGNTGNALALVAAAKGYKMVVVMPSGFSKERVAISEAFGAEMRLTEGFAVTRAREIAIELGQQDGWWCPQQFDNEWNVENGSNVLGPEIIEQIPAGVTIDALVQGVGTGGTLIGVGRALRNGHNARLKTYAMEPAEATTIEDGAFEEHLIEGIADGFIPSIYERHAGEVSGTIAIKGVDAVNEMKNIARKYGVFVGPSSGANLIAARRLKAENKDINTVLTFFCDEGEKYLHQHFMPQAA